MEAHPIPQNVTSFEFHLIGDMTVKQFAYLAGGGVIGFFIYLVFSSQVPLVAWPLIAMFVLTGIAFAFLPISERPLDHWLLAYVRAITNPTQAVWRDDASQIGSELFNDRLKIYFGLVPMPHPGIAPTAPKTSRAAPIQSQTKPPLETKKPPAKIKRKHSTAILSRPTTVSPVIKKPAPPVTKPEHKGSLFIELGEHPKVERLPLSNPTKPSQEPLFVPNQNAISLPPEPALPTTEELKETVELARKAHEVQQEILETEHQMNQIKSTAALPGADPGDFTEVFEEVITKLQSLTKEESEISHEMAVLSESHHEEAPPAPPPSTPRGTPMPQPTANTAPPPLNPSQQPQPPTPPAPREVQPIPQTGIPAIIAEPKLGLHPLPKIAMSPIAREAKPAAAITISLTSTPNIINGIVTDAQNNYLEGVIVVTHDKQGLPVRALKTNKLGQFVAATPLPNGTYTLTVEKDNLSFDTVEVELAGQVLSPIMISAKKGGVI